MNSARALACLRLAYGSALLLAPDALLGDLTRARTDRRARLFARVLGARHVVETAVLWRHRSRRWLLGGAAVDGLHAATMIGLALIDEERRGPANANALGAAAFALAGLYEAART